MKKFLILTVLMVASVACSLDETFPGINQKNYYETVTQCRSAVNGVYIEAKSMMHSTLMIMFEGCTDLWHWAGTTVDGELQITPSKPEQGADLWFRCYRGVDLCNEVIHCIDRSEHIADSLRNEMTAECRVMRAFYYYMLTNTFNGVPYYTAQVDTYAVQDSIRYLPRTDANEIRRMLYDDLEYNAIPHFEKNKNLKVMAYKAPSKRSGYAFALMLQAKFAMWYQDWTAALKPLQALEILYKEFNEKNFPLEQIMWRYDHVAESIFEIVHEYDLTGIQYYGSFAKVMMPGYNKDEDLFDGVKLTGYGNTLTGASAMKSNRNFANYKTKTSLYGEIPKDLTAIPTGEYNGKKVDRRIQYKLGLGNLETGKVFNMCNNNGYTYPGPQFWCPDILNNYDSNNYRLFRYADAILMMAECWCMQNDFDQALHYLNLVRARAGIENITTVSGKEELMLEIRNERARELAGELHRKFDLVRWGIWYEQTRNNTDYNSENYPSKATPLASNIRPCHRYYPIPDTQCALSGYILDNPEYKESGLN